MRYIFSLLVVVIIGIGFTAEAAPPVVEGEYVYGCELMTDEEITVHREQMMSAKTSEERQQIREEHHKAMLKRADEKGVTLKGHPSMKMPGKGMMSDCPCCLPQGRGSGMGRGYRR